MIKAIKKIFAFALVAGITLVILQTNTFGQNYIHPKKKIFQDVKTWKTTAPGSVKLKNFTPFRAVYNRTYKQGAGPNAGDERKDRVIVTAENVGWDGQKAVALTLIDSGVVEHSDTMARVYTMFFGLDNLNTLFEIGPIPGKGKDYYIARFDKEMIYLNQITTDTQKLESKKIPTNVKGFGPNTWTMASMDLKTGLKISLAPIYSPKANSLTTYRYGHIVKKETFTDGSGKKYNSWVLETSGNLSSPRVSHVHLIDRPPYYLGTETVNLDTGERKPFTWLKNVTLLDK